MTLFFLSKASRDAKQINGVWSVTGNKAGKESGQQSIAQIDKHKD